MSSWSGIGRITSFETEPSISLIFSEFELRPECLIPGEHAFPYRKPGDPGYNMITQRPVPSCDLRGFGYLATIVGRNLKIASVVTSDTEVRAKLDFSFI